MADHFPIRLPTHSTRHRSRGGICSAFKSRAIMSFRENHSESRDRYLAAYNAEEAIKYDGWVSALTEQDHDACLQDINRCVQFSEGMSVLDAGAGTGALCLTLSRVPGLRITALEPCPAMIDKLREKPQLSNVTTALGFCDHADDQSHFAAGEFDLIASRQLVNCLYDPLSAFRNWHYWLRPSGQVVVVDGLFDRTDWCGILEESVDSLPLSACRTTATTPYLLEQAGFKIDFVGFMDATNAMPRTRTERYMVVATKQT